jgi:hypothetical protein
MGARSLSGSATTVGIRLPRLRRSAILRRAVVLSLAAALFLSAAPAATVDATKRIDVAQSADVAFGRDDRAPSADAVRAALGRYLPADGATPIYPLDESALRTVTVVERLGCHRGTRPPSVATRHRGSVSSRPSVECRGSSS